jgi:hypothetical protein
MLKLLQGIPIPVLLVIATTLEVSGDALIRSGVYRDGNGLGRVAIFCAGGLLLFGYGYFLNTAPVEFGRIVGLYIATLFIIWQLVSFLVSRAVPTLPVLTGGLLIIAGGLIVTFWQK